MTQAHYIVGDTREVTATIPDSSIDLILTSPPFLALRSYLPADHPDKAREIGSEATPAAFIDVLLELSAEWRRVLAPHGSIAIELGDTYSGSSQSSGDRSAEQRGVPSKQRRGAADPNEPNRSGNGWPLGKSLALIPELYRVALAYGVNPLTGQPSPAGRWRVRNVVRWHRPNPPVGALGDKYRPATTDMVIATPARNRWFDLDAVRTAHSDPGHVQRNHLKDAAEQRGDRETNDEIRQNAIGAPPLDTWVIPTAPYKGAHFAAFPPKLCEIPIKSMCPLEVCVGCGTPRRRIVEVDGLSGSDFLGKHNDRGIGLGGARPSMPDITRTTLGWTVCDCPTPTYRPGLVLDPFAGTGTTLAVATGHGRNALGIDLDLRNLALAHDRVGGLVMTNGPQLPEWFTQ